MDAIDTKFSIARDGMIVVNDTTQYAAKSFKGLYVASDSVISELSDITGDVKANYITTPANTVPAGVIISSLTDAEFLSVTLTSGCVIPIF